MSELLAASLEQEKRGELKGIILMTATDEGTQLGILGKFAGHMQFAGYTLIKALNTVGDKIVESGTIGHTHSNSVHEVWKAPRRQQPKRLREATGFRELE